MKKGIQCWFVASFLFYAGSNFIGGGSDPKATLLQLFDTYDLVAVSEFHRANEVHQFLRSLIQSKGLSDKHVTNIVVEFGNAKYQDLADRYVMGEQVPASEVRQIWQNTTQFLAWDSPLYEQFFRTVKEANSQLPRPERIRIILGDPPIGWEITHTKADYERYADRDLFYANVVEREVLNRNQKALLIAGGLHLINAREQEKDIPDKSRSAGDLLHRRHPRKLFVLWSVKEPIPAVQCGVPCIMIVRGSNLENQSFAPFAPKGILVQKINSGEKQWVPLDAGDWPSVVRMTDGLIYFGANLTTIDPNPKVYQDTIYVKELRRRAAILSEVYGMDFGKQLDEAISSGAGK